MPFSERWFYGDALFIIDPWLWLLLAAGVVIATAGWAPGHCGWGLVGAATTALLMTIGAGADRRRACCWVVGLAAIVAARAGGERVRARVQQIARWCLVVGGGLHPADDRGQPDRRRRTRRQWLEREGRSLPVAHGRARSGQPRHPGGHRRARRPLLVPRGQRDHGARAARGARGPHQRPDGQSPRPRSPRRAFAACAAGSASPATTSSHWPGDSACTSATCGTCDSATARAASARRRSIWTSTLRPR